MTNNIKTFVDVNMDNIMQMMKSFIFLNKHHNNYLSRHTIKIDFFLSNKEKITRPNNSK